MAHSNRLTKLYLEDFVSNKDELYRQGFFPLLRYLDANAPLAKRIGYSISPKQDAFRLGQTPLLHFHSSAFTDVVFDKVNGNHKLKNSYWGLLGINGPLPSHITEYAIEREYRFKDDTLTEFLDIFHHRFISLFYRAWADAQPTASFDRADNDVFTRRIAVFTGNIETPKKTNQDVSRSNKDFINHYLAGLYSQKNRSATSLSQMISEYIKFDVSIQQYVGVWYALDDSECSTLGQNNVGLGSDTILGGRTFQRSFNFAIVIGPLDYEQYIKLLDDPEKFATIKRLAVKAIGNEFQFTIKILLKPNQTQSSHLGQSRLGINSWCRDKEGEHLTSKPVITYERVC